MPQLKRTNSIANGIAVRRLALPDTRAACSRHHQISMYALAAVVSAIFFVLDYRLLQWRRSGKEVDGDRIWKNLRLFSGWTCAGCMAGAVSFALYLQWRSFLYESIRPGMTDNGFYEAQASSYRHRAAFSCLYPLHLLCIIYAMNALLRRVSDHASHSYYNIARDHARDGRSSVRKQFDCRDCLGQYALYYWVRSMRVIALLFCMLHTIAGVISGGFSADSAARLDYAAAETDSAGRDTNTSLQIFKDFIPSADLANQSNAVSRAFEATVLVFVASGFLLFFPAIIVMFHRVELRLDTLIREMYLRSDQGTAFLPFEFSPRAADGSETQTEMPIVEVRQYLGEIKSSATAQRRRFLFCLLFIMAALLVLSGNSVLLTYLNAYGTLNPDCELCGTCQDIQFNMLIWYRFTPELFPLLAFLSTTLPLVFSLWLMTTPEDRALLLQPSRFLTDSITLQPIVTEREASLRAERIRLGINLQ